MIYILVDWANDTAYISKLVKINKKEGKHSKMTLK